MIEQSIVTILQNILTLAFPLFLAITMHTAAQCYIAYKQGDSTPKFYGRISINPSKHMDILGTIILPLISFLGSSGGLLFGYAKPAPIDSRNFKNPRKSLFLSILAGPVAHLIMALLWAIIAGVLVNFIFADEFFTKMAKGGIMINLSLFAINMLPLPPLDGGKLLAIILPYKYGQLLSRIEPYAFFVLLLISSLSILRNFWLMPIINILSRIIGLILSLIGLN
jgi:Zn-dependent protease